jgi:hypothetical protein
MTDSLHSQLLQMADDMIGPYRNLALAAAKELQLQTWHAYPVSTHRYYI